MIDKAPFWCRTVKRNMGKIRGNPFKKGHKRMGGRAKGTPNKFTTLKDAFINAFVRVGGEDGIVDWLEAGKIEIRTKKGTLVKTIDLGGQRKEVFFKIIGGMLPKDVVLSGGVGLAVTSKLEEARKRANEEKK